MLEPPTPTLPHKGPHKGGGSAPSKRLAGPSASVRESARRHAPFWLSLLAGMALWEIVGRNSSAAFMVPFTETMRRLWQLIVSGGFFPALFDSAVLFLTGFVLAVAVGLPLGLFKAKWLSISRSDATTLVSLTRHDANFGYAGRT